MESKEIGDLRGRERRRFPRCQLDRSVPLHLGPHTVDAVLVDLSAGGLRLRCTSVQLAAPMFQLYLARSDDRGVVAWGRVVRSDGAGFAIEFAKVEPDGKVLLADLPAWVRHPVTAIYISPAAVPAGRAWWTEGHGD